jgi:hypothetical protein
MVQPSFADLYNLARVYASLTTMVETGSARSTSAEREALADRGMEALRRCVPSGSAFFDVIERDQSLDPLRERPDFRALMLDRGFPRDPFANP